MRVWDPHLLPWDLERGPEGQTVTRTSLEFFLMYLERFHFDWVVPKSVTVSFENVMCAVLKAQTVGCLPCRPVSRWHRAEQVLWLKRGFGSYIFITVNHFHDLFHKDDYIINNISFSWPEISEVPPELISWICVELYISPTQPPFLYPWPGFARSLFLNAHLSLPPSSSFFHLSPPSLFAVLGNQTQSLLYAELPP